jgi:glycosyltransferase involved in cell wall biosynthesis
VPHEEVPIWLNASDVVLLTSLHEGSPNIIKEALACDLPVVSVDVGDVRERIDGIEGCHIALPDPDDLGIKLSLVAANKGRIAGREKMQSLSLEHTALHLRSFYREVVESHQRQGIASRTMINPSLLVHFCLSILTRRKNFSGQPKRH